MQNFARHAESDNIFSFLFAGGRKEEVHFDKITSRIQKLCYGLNMDFVDPISEFFVLHTPNIGITNFVLCIYNLSVHMDIFTYGQFTYDEQFDVYHFPTL